MSGSRLDVDRPGGVRSQTRGRLRPALLLLAAYAALLAALAFWPTPVDADLRWFLRAITRLVPVLTYPRIEFLANVALFVPLGILLAVVFRRARHLVLPVVFLTTFVIECTQALLLPERTPSVMDIVANTAGGCAGLILASAFEAARRRPPGAPARRPDDPVAYD